ncbi:MAG: aminotransferase class V-fold PLP-dependent enzyme [Actinobacteria bacterium]|nr:aminotransferase class V-fold PLP-dependent enzyme [Actinomycetota bacterium]
MADRFVYLDHAASTPMRAVARAILADPDDLGAANASGSHRAARRARALVDDARERLAELLAVNPGDVVFTSGGTESDNLAVFGRAAAVPGLVLCSAIEHPAVLEAVERVGGERVAAGGDGRMDLDALEARLRRAVEGAEPVSLVSVMALNNEVGSIQPVVEAAELVRSLAPSAAVHSDAVQALPWIDLRSIGAAVDLLSLSGHKFGGPQGVGALVIRSGTRLVAQHVGGGQEREWRSGTLNVAGIAAMVAAAVETDGQRKAETARLARLRDRLVGTVRAGIGDALWTGERIGLDRLAAGFAHFCFDGIEAEALLFLLDSDGVCASAASACASGAQHPSHVLEAMGLTRETARGSLRISLGHTTTETDIDAAAASIVAAVERLRSRPH